VGITTAICETLFMMGRDSRLTRLTILGDLFMNLLLGCGGGMLMFILLASMGHDAQVMTVVWASSADLD